MGLPFPRLRPLPANRRREGRNPGVEAPFPGPGRFQSEYWKDIVPAWLVDEQMLVQDSRAAKPIGGYAVCTTALRLDDYYDSYRLLAAYLAYLDTLLDRPPATNT